MRDYLSRYVHNLHIITADESDNHPLPAAWSHLLALKQAERIEWVIQSWQKMGDDLRNITYFLAHHLVAIDLIHSSRGFGMIYSIRKEDGNIAYYEGRPPVVDIELISNSYLREMPSTLQQFYQQLHNGWYYFASVSMGPMPLEDVFFLDKYEWGILDNLPPLDFELKQCLAIFNNGMGDYLSLDLSGNEAKGLLWYHDQAPKVNIDFWDYLDEWMCIGLE